MMLRWLLRPFQADPSMSLEWLRSQKRLTQRVPFEGVPIQWPIDKLITEHPRKLKAVAKKRA